MNDDPAARSTRTKRTRVAVVDDNAELRAALADLLVAEGYEVESFADGRGALDLLTQRRGAPALVILDLEMPQVSGWDVLKALQAVGHRGRKPAVVVLSAAEEAPDPIPGVRWAKKPIGSRELITLVSTALRGNGCS